MVPHVHPLLQAAWEVQRGLVTPCFPVLLHPLSKLAPPMGDFTIVPICVLTEQFLPPPEQQEHESVAAWSKPPCLTLTKAAALL